MAKYVDAGVGEAPSTAGAKKKRSKKGFKADRRANYERMMARKITGKDVKSPAERRPTRVKSIVFDDTARKDYLLTLHKRKNERRVQAFVDVKKKLRRDNARTRRQQREEARRAYNSYARVPILPNYTFRIPDYTAPQDGPDNDDDDEDDDWEAEDASDSNEERHASVSASHEPDSAEDNDNEAGASWVYMGDAVDGGDEELLQSRLREKRRQRKIATKARTRHIMPASMTNDDGGCENDTEARLSRAHADTVTVEVKPLLGARGAGGDEDGKGRATSTLPSNSFSDLPAVVEEELRRLRRDTKGPSRTPSKVHMMKELEKIRKIKKHSRKGHGKRKASGKKKNRKK